MLKWYEQTKWPSYGKYLGLLTDPYCKTFEGAGGYLCSEEYMDILRYNSIYEPEFIEFINIDKSINRWVKGEHIDCEG